MEKETNPNTNSNSAKSKTYFIIGYVFLMAMALAWSVDAAIVYIFFGIGAYFLFLGIYSRPTRKNFQEAFRSTGTQSRGSSSAFSDIIANIFQTSRPAAKPTAKIFARPRTPEENRRFVGFVITGVFIMFFFFFIGSVFFSSSEGWDDSVVSFQTAEEYYVNGNYDSAYIHYRRAWRANDQYAEAMVGYGKVLAIRNQQDSAMIMFDKALTIAPDYLEASYNKALIYYNRANYGESIAILVPLLEKNPDYYDAMLLVGDSYYEQKQFDDALNWYTNAYENGGIRSRALCHLMAYIYDTKGDYSRAIDLYKEALSYDSTVVDIYVRLGELLQNEEGIYYRTQAVKLKEN
jgi:tetratricopeptide (TPR) repeat protein